MTPLDAATFKQSIKVNGSQETHVTADMASIGVDFDRRVVVVTPKLRGPTLLIPLENAVSLQPASVPTKRSKNSELTERA